MWRPEDWQKQIGLRYGAIAGIDAKMFEAGADAILEALRGKGIHRENQPFDAPPNTGTWAFIPDEEG